MNDQRLRKESNLAVARPAPKQPALPVADRDLLDRLGAGSPLPTSLVEHVGAVFQRDLSAVRVHPASEEPARLGTRAFALRDHIAFAPGQLDFVSTPGRRLMMHELAHVVQQGGGTGGNQLGGRPTEFDVQAERAAVEPVGVSPLVLSAVSPTSATFVQRDPTPPLPVQVMPDVLLTEDPTLRRATLTFRGKPWITVQYGAHVREWLEFGTEGWNSESVGIRIASPDRIQVTVDVDVERELRESRSSLGNSSIAYDFSFPGAVTVRDRGLTTKLAGPARRLTHDYTQQVPTIEGLPAPPTRFHDETWLASETTNSYPSFADLEQLRKFLEANPQKSFAIVRTKDGHYVARPVSAEELRKLAQRARASHFDKTRLEDIDWYDSAYASGEFQGLWVEGKEYTELASLRDQFFESPEDAGKDELGNEIECEVYEMGPISSSSLASLYGRKVLSHADAQKRMRELDDMSKKQVDVLETEPGRRFFSLHLRGVSGKVHHIASWYFGSRDNFRESLAKIDALPKGDYRVLAFLGYPTDALQHEQERDQQGAFFSEFDYEQYIAFEIDRGEDNPTFIAQLRAHQGLAARVGERHYAEIEQAGQEWAADSFDKSARQLREFVADDQKLATWVLTASAQPQEVYKTLEYLDLADDALHFYHALLDPAESMIIASGGTTSAGFSLETLHAAVEKVAASMDEGQRSILRGDIIAIKQEGAFGDAVREGVYKEYGYTLDPKSFGLKLSGGDAFGYDPMRGDRASFSSLSEQLFATQLRRQLAEDEVWHWAKVIGMALATVVLVVVLNAAGGAIAEGMFGLAEGTAGYFAASAVIVGTGLTAFEWTQAKIAGYDMTWGELLKAEGWNVATAGLLGRLGYEFKALAAPLRVSIVGAAGFSLGLARFLADHKGPITGKELLHFMIENAVMFAAMEAAGVFARPFTSKLALWGRARRLGIEPQALADYQVKLSNLMRDLQGYRARPADAPADAARIEAQVAEILAAQEKIANDIAKKATLFGDGDKVRAELQTEVDAIRGAMENMKLAHFLARLKLQPLGDSKSIFSYEPSSTAVEDIKRFFHDGVVEPQPDGTIRITLPGSEGSVLLVPSTSAAATVSDAATAKVDINSASERELTKLPGIGKKLAKAIIAARLKAGGYFKSVDDLVDVPGIGQGKLETLLPLIEAQDEATITARRQTSLVERQNALLDRAERLGYEHETLDAIARSKLRVGSSTKPETLDAAEAKIAAAEKTAGKAMDRASRAALKRTLGKLGVDAARLRSGSLANLTDEQVGDALARIAGRQKFTVEALRGIVWAHVKGVPIEKLMAMAEGYNTATRNRILDTFGRLADAGVTNCEKVLSDMSISGDKWDGGMFMLDVARFGYGIENIAGFEMRISGEGGNRDVDIVLKNGMRLELKNWRTLRYLSSLADASNAKDPGQFLVDCANGGFKPDLLDLHRYIFRAPAPETPAKIKAYLRQQLVKYMDAAGIEEAQRDAFLAKFDSTLDLVSESTARADGAISDLPKVPQTLLMPVQPRRDDDKSRLP